MMFTKSRVLSRLVPLCMALLMVCLSCAAVAEEDKGRMEQIFSILEQTTDDPQTLSDYDRLATMAFARGEYEQALSYLDKCIELVGDQDASALGVLWTQKGAILARMEQTDSALEALAKAAEYTPQNLQLLLLRAELSMAQGEARKAISDYEQYLALMPEDAATWALLAEAQTKAGDKQTAGKSREKAQELSKNQENVILSQARNEYLNGNFEAAISGCDVYLETMEDATGDVHFLRGAAKMQAGQQAEAVEDLNKAISLGYAEPAVAYEFLSSCYFVMGDYAKVLEVSEKSIATGSDVPAYDTMYQRMGVSAMTLDRYDEAIGYFEKSMEINDTLVGNHYYRGMSYMASEQYEAAIEEFTVSIDREEVLQRCLYNRGVCNIQIDQFDAGIADLERTIQMEDDPELSQSASEILWQLALHYMSEETE